MSEKAITIYTPSDAEPHITADDDAFIYNSILGGKSGILGDLQCAIDGSNVVLEGGGVSNRGYIMRIPDGESVTLSVPNGTQGMYRVDLVVSQFTKGGGVVSDSHKFVLIKGTPSSMPVIPKVTTSSLLNSGDVNQIALFYVMLSGTEILRVVQTANNLMSDVSVPKIYVQSDEPTSPETDDLWFWGEEAFG